MAAPHEHSGYPDVCMQLSMHGVEGEGYVQPLTSLAHQHMAVPQEHNV